MARAVRATYVWPMGQVLFWTVLILATACTILGVFAQFISIQNRMGLEVPWLFPYGVTVGAITLALVVIMLVMLGQSALPPAVMIIFSFILIVLYITGLVDTAIQLFGPGNVSSNCQRWVNNSPQSGATVQTLAWLQQNNICSCWYAVFAFWLIGTLFFLWMFVMAAQVSSRTFG